MEASRCDGIRSPRAARYSPLPDAPATVLVLLLFSALGCGHKADPASEWKRLDAELERRIVFASPKGNEGRRADSWDERRVQPFKSAVDLIRTGESDLQVLDPCAGARALLSSRVVLVTDLHDVEQCRDGLLRLITLLRGCTAAPKLGVLLEAVPIEREKDVCGAIDDAKSGSGSSIVRQALGAHWCWPLAGYVRLMMSPQLEGVDLLGGGPAWHLPQRSPPPPDHLRRPETVHRPVAPDELPSSEHLPFYTEKRLVSENRRAISRAQEWLRIHPDGQLIVLFGIAHLSGGDGSLERLFDEAGVSPVIVVNSIPDIELAILRRNGAIGWDSWVKLGPNMLRMPGTREW